MHASSAQDRVGSADTADTGAAGVLPRPGEVKLFIHKPGWAQPVGWALSMWHDWTGNDETEFTYLRIELKDFHLSHAAALFLLQGASLKTLFADVIADIGSRGPENYSLAFSESPMLTLPPPRIRRVVLARIFERNANITPDAAFEQIFLKEATRSSF